jgi:hypothetical protein
LELLPFLNHQAMMAAAINGKRRRSESARLPSPSSLWPYLNSRSSSCPPLCLLSTPTHTLEHQFHWSAASGSRRRRREFVVAGEGLVPLPFLLDSWDCQGLIKHVLLQDHVLDASRSSYTVRRSAAGIAVDAGPLLRFFFRSRSRFWFCTSR